MPAEVWAITLAVGERTLSGAKYRAERVSGSRDNNNPDPTRGRMAGQERRIDDTILIREAQRGDRAAFEELVRHYDQAVLRLALHLTGAEHDAQDVYQDAFLKAYKNIGSFRFECSFYTWLYRIVMNRCLDYLRRRRNPHETAGLKVGLDSGDGEVLRRLADRRYASNPESKLAAREMRTRITRALEKLTPCERAVFELRHYQDLKLRAVAGILNTSEGNARHALFRARQKLRSALAEVR
jgi:RNA polymerase sigma-70 factor, ECF subfamily